MTSSETVRVYRVASYNVHSCVGVDRRCSPERIADVIAELDADTLALQEVDTRHHRGQVLSQIEWLAERTGLTPIAGPTLNREHGPYGNAILTRWPPIAVRQHDLSVGGYEPRGALEIEVEIEGEPVHILATHLGLAGRERHHQVEALVALIEGLRGGSADAQAGAKILLLGDFNEWWPASALSRRLRTLGMTPHPRTYPSWCPMFALDRICAFPMSLLRGPPRTHASLLSRIASDHLPVVADLAHPPSD